jgi:hypothetical protein
MKFPRGRKFLYLILFIAVAICSMVVANLCFGSRLPKNIEQKAEELYAYCQERGYNTQIGILVDYSLYSGRNRYFVWDFAKGEAVVSSVSPLGCGKGRSYGRGKFSNDPGSQCTSLGHYKIGKERQMNSLNRKCFELDGLDSSNSNARSRLILLHPSSLPSISVYPLPIISAIPYSAGCITMPFSKYDETAKLLKSVGDKPVIMWVYN